MSLLPVLSRLLSAVAAAMLTGVAMTSCDKIDYERIPYAPVRIQFRSQGDWVAFGVGGAGETRRFILRDRVPAGFPYNAMSATGFGGVLIVGDYNGELRAFDLACPVECRASVRIVPITDSGEPRGECPVCHSTYDIFRYGGPLTGPAAQHHYGLTHYFIGPGLSGDYMSVTN